MAEERLARRRGSAGRVLDRGDHGRRRGAAQRRQPHRAHLARRREWQRQRHHPRRLPADQCSRRGRRRRTPKRRSPTAPRVKVDVVGRDVLSDLAVLEGAERGACAGRDGTRRGPAGGPARGGRRQSARPRGQRHRRHRVRAGPLVADEIGQGGRRGDPDRRRTESRKQRRRTRRRARPDGRRQHCGRGSRPRDLPFRSTSRRTGSSRR